MSDTTTIYLLRHAAYENPKKIFHGRLPGFPLSAKGRAQAKKLGKLLLHKGIIAMYSSPLTRASQTAEILSRALGGIPITLDDRLMDIRSPLEGKPKAYIDAIKSDFYRKEFIAKGGERLREVFERMDACIRDIVKRHPGQHVAVVSHGDPIMSIKYKYSGNRLPRSFPYDTAYIPQASGFIIHFKNGSIQSLKPLRP